MNQPCQHLLEYNVKSTEVSTYIRPRWPANQKAQFHQFAKLAPELQRMIFEESLPEGRIISLKAVEILVETPDKWTREWYSTETFGGKYKSARIVVSTTLPTLLHVNSMAREIAQEKYKLEFSHCLPHPVYFNFEIDTLYIQSDRAVRLLQGTSHRLKRLPTPLSRGLDIAKMQEKLKYLMLGEPCLFKTTTEMIARFENLEVLELKEGCFRKEQKFKILNNRWYDRWGEDFPYECIELSDKEMGYKLEDMKDGYGVYIKPRRSPRLMELEANKKVDSNEGEDDEA
ncbi:hypothetical protein SS1G_07506 [Sclerotinia sclerotiorum 1980 UF-70]|uniref:2EXR domain-containing protein n=2 Tax=Sclerotinia sclerotiorum (strain ATCC 18683 / 1980 / Ss-1) TaxID=665079 RepID=A7EQA5_SCLS1|nr:hypothetical protein SS1G_07506 [Sclerotinia sclerotiorum 1980 UF-70]APA10109.1 hypothetical protein sscle_06g048790 [Sclerotinia sclerotiorum 1980 UF-70]EDO05021.1 hypothetical protein SS1G_07506 [Sclerotinia sclerotiorum 1980 UF-70]